MGVYTNSSAVRESSLEDFLSSADTTSFNPYGFMVDTYRADQALFEALIEVDFAEVYNESGMLLLTEAEKEKMDKTPKEGIWKKITTAIKRLKDWVAGFFKMIFEKIQEIATSNKKLIEKYGKYMTVENLKDCPATGRYVDMTELTNAVGKNVDTASITNSLSRIETASAEDVDSVAEDIIATCKSTIEILSKLEPVKNSGDKPIVKVAGDTVVKQMIEDVKTGLKKSKEVCKVAVTKARETVDTTQKNISGKLSKETDSKKLNALSRVVTAISDMITRYSKTAMSFIKASISASKAFWLKAGPCAAKKAGSPVEKVQGEEVSEEEFRKAGGDKLNNESAEMENAELLAEMSDMYIDDVFEFEF